MYNFKGNFTKKARTIFGDVWLDVLHGTAMTAETHRKLIDGQFFCFVLCRICDKTSKRKNVWFFLNCLFPIKKNETSQWHYD